MMLYLGEQTLHIFSVVYASVFFRAFIQHILHAYYSYRNKYITSVFVCSVQGVQKGDVVGGREAVSGKRAGGGA